MSDRYLFRGVSEKQYTTQHLGLAPKKVGEFSYVFHLGEVVDQSTGRVFGVGEGVVCGENEVNAVLRHQIDPPAGFPTAGVSTTPHSDRAEYYATYGRTGSQDMF